MVLEKIFTQEECAYLRANAVNEILKVSWSEIKEKGIIIYGCGVAGKYFHRFLKKYDIQPLYFIDKKLSGTKYKDIEIYSAEKLNDAQDSYVLLGGNFINEMYSICKSHKVKNILFIFQLPEYPAGHFFEKNFLTHVETDERYTSLYNLLQDDASRKVLKNILSFRITHDYNFFKNYSIIDHYFPVGLKDYFDYSVFCDCGAYNGDTFLQWINNKEVEHKKYIGIEASKSNFKALEKTLSTYTNIEKELHYCALGKEKGQAYFSDDNMASTFSSTGDEIEIYPLDELILKSSSTQNNHYSPPPTFIKMDIEGAEIDAIHGLKHFLKEKEKLKEGKTTLAISIYHYPDDLYSIPFLILKYAPSAKIYIRHHSKMHIETVCYAVI